MTKPDIFTDTDGVEMIDITVSGQPAPPVEALPISARDYIRALSFYTPELEEHACLALHAYKEAELWGRSATNRQRRYAHERIENDVERLIKSMEALPYATLVFGYGKEEGGAVDGLVDTVREIKEKAQALLSEDGENTERARPGRKNMRNRDVLLGKLAAFLTPLGNQDTVAEEVTGLLRLLGVPAPNKEDAIKIARDYRKEGNR